MTFTLINKLFPENRMCVTFFLIQNDTTRTQLENNTIFWDCYIFEKQRVEDNFFDFILEDDEFNGGIYNFKIPSIANHGKHLHFRINFFV